MKKELLSAAAVAVMLASPAFAQSTSPSAPSSNTPSATTPAPGAAGTTAPSTTAPATGGSAATMNTGGTTAFISEQMQEQWLASNLIGTKVRGTGDESVGEVNDVLLDRNGNVVGAVIGVGGFLGMGEKDVAVPFTALQMVRNSDGDRLILNKSKDELKNAPTFKEYTRSGTGTATGTGATPPAGAPATTR
ncbi:PRC-barrel domain-containing protein [Aquabacter sp. L1I39]|uniref:PRC-barrel domain-containing protein n=1 Tax=Aquabacter sp. L1I39 TaxID=2820278 RepID=UPI001ADBA5B1|nr:PRC-barrel domain-containing protein [Aquabacter sp. L1I39]QTL03792.1 PRC-barrel domain-containing protein [Aquabacter sp. L1I39]